MSEALATEFECRPPAVVYNAFPWSDRQTLDAQFKDRRDPTLPSLHWYSQTLGAGRGLEDLVAALPLVKRKIELHLRGNPTKGFVDWLYTSLSEELRSRVFIHELVSNEDLLSRIAEHDIGLAGEQTYCRSRDLTITNKILHYLLAGLAVVASDTLGQREVAEQAKGAVSIYRADDPSSIAERLNILLSNPECLKYSKIAALKAAERTFCWERQSTGLLSSAKIATESK